ncbi:MAG: hypothetical protein J0L72_04555, partial [Armatimonadetes bacterium]|nr:hypothetical protein [Armatimonadota bacterium]
MAKFALACAMTAGLLASGQAITWTMQSVSVPGATSNLQIQSFNSQGTMAIKDSGTGKIYRRLRSGAVSEFISNMAAGSATAMNENGDVAIGGFNFDNQGNAVQSIWMWNANGTVENWHNPSPPGSGASLSTQGINESRQVVGYGVRFDPDMYGAYVSYSPTSSMVLTELGGSFAKDISNDGTIVGMNEYRPGTWDLAGNYTALPLPVGDTSGAAHVITES